MRKRIEIFLNPPEHEVIEVACVDHGPMKFRFPFDRYACVGFDGEGCDTEITSEELDTILGKVNEAEPGSVIRSGRYIAWQNQNVIVKMEGRWSE